MKGNQKAVNKFQDLVLNNVPIFVTSISIYEIYLGIVANLHLKGGRPVKVPELISTNKQFLLNCNILDFTQESAEKAAEIYAQLQGKGITVKEKDCLIAGIAIVNGISEIITRDRTDFEKIYEICGLKYVLY